MNPDGVKVMLHISLYQWNRVQLSMRKLIVKNSLLLRCILFIRYLKEYQRIQKIIDGCGKIHEKILALQFQKRITDKNVN